MATVLITGTSTGIGMATAVTLARAGHDVVATMRNPDGGSALHEALAEEKLEAQILPMDVDDDASVERTMAQVRAERGRIDALVNNAGISGAGPVEEVPLEVFRRVMETNYFGALRCIQAVLPGMRERRGGCIVNVTSVAGRMASAPQAPYAASKFALEALSECLAQEVCAFGIRVAVVEPGVIATPIFGKGQHAASLPADSPYPHLRRLRALFAASLERPVSPFVVGEQIRAIVDGETDKFRHPVGPDAEKFMANRGAVSDEKWVQAGAASDEEWVSRMNRLLGLDIKL